MAESLESFRLTKGGKEAVRRQSRQQTLTPAYKGQVFAFDQAIANTGWAIMRAEGNGFVVEQTGHIKTEVGDRQGFYDTFRRVDEMAGQVRKVFRQHLGNAVLAYEMPAVGGHRTDSSLQAATIVRVEADAIGVHEPLMVSAQQVKKRVTGNARADKAATRAALHRLMPLMSKQGLRPLNEHVYDAMALAIVVICEEDWSQWQ
jgi:Holliday junction resolvasome RuvABC endonuclease subunit